MFAQDARGKPVTYLLLLFGKIRQVYHSSFHAQWHRNPIPVQRCNQRPKSNNWQTMTSGKIVRNEVAILPMTLLGDKSDGYPLFICLLDTGSLSMAWNLGYSRSWL